MSIELMNWVWKVTNTAGTERLVLLALADAANDRGYCWPSIQTLAIKAGVSRRYVIEILKSLEAKGLLKKTRRIDDFGDFTSNMYKLVVNPITPPSEPEFTTVVNQSSLPSEAEITRGSEPGITRVVNQGSLNPPFNHNIEPPINQGDGSIALLSDAFSTASNIMPYRMDEWTASCRNMFEAGVTPQELKQLIYQMRNPEKNQKVLAITGPWSCEKMAIGNHASGGNNNYHVGASNG